MQRHNRVRKPPAEDFTAGEDFVLTRLFIESHADGEGALGAVGGIFCNYLLEFSRIVNRLKGKKL